MKSAIPTTNRRELFRVARAALQQYGLENTVLRLVGDVHNIVFRVTARPRSSRRTRHFALRLHATDWLSAADIESELVWLEAIRQDTSIIVPKPVRNRPGQWLATASFNGTSQRTCTLFHWLEGRVHWKRPSTDWLRKIGRLMKE